MVHFGAPAFTQPRNKEILNINGLKDIKHELSAAIQKSRDI